MTTKKFVSLAKRNRLRDTIFCSKMLDALLKIIMVASNELGNLN
jgi:hypothetical protein